MPKPDTDRPMPSRYVTARSTETRRAILEGAIDCIVAMGHHRMTLTNVADFAGVSRGGLKYYYASIDALNLDLYPLVMDSLWSAHENAVRARPNDVDPVAYAVQMIGRIDVDRYKIARMELLTAARTLPDLLAVVVKTARVIDARRAAFIDEIFAERGISQRANFRAANDMSSVIDDWLPLQPFGEDRDHRIALVNRALRLSLLMLWRTPEAVIEGTGKLRVRVPAEPADRTTGSG